jgi:quercetin dioxygenase-like cupin family protein
MNGSRSIERGLLVDKHGSPGEVVTSWGERSRVRISRSAVKGGFAILDYHAPPGFGPPRHRHRKDDEIFHILSGAIVIWTRASCRTARAGDLVLLPCGEAHTWRAVGEAAVHFQVTVTRGDFETLFDDIVARSLSPSDTDGLMQVALDAGVDVLGPPLSDDEVALILSGSSLNEV